MYKHEMEFSIVLTEIVSVLHMRGFERIQNPNKYMTVYSWTHPSDKRVDVHVAIDGWEQIYVKSIFNGKSKFAFFVELIDFRTQHISKVLSRLEQGIEAARTQATEWISEQVTKEVMSC